MSFETKPLPFIFFYISFYLNYTKYFKCAPTPATTSALLKKKKVGRVWGTELQKCGSLATHPLSHTALKILLKCFMFVCSLLCYVYFRCLKSLFKFLRACVLNIHERLGHVNRNTCPVYSCRYMLNTGYSRVLLTLLLYEWGLQKRKEINWSRVSKPGK